MVVDVESSEKPVDDVVSIGSVVVAVVVVGGVISSVVE